MTEHCRSRIRLQIFIVGDQLHDPIPHLRPDMVARSSDELQDSVDIPLVLTRQLSPCKVAGLLTSVAKRSVKMAILRTMSSLRL